jgi:prepilin-type N-terminal cleavage/methylation domain-containing protein
MTADGRRHKAEMPARQIARTVEPLLLPTGYSVLSTQYSVLSAQHPAFSIQHSAFCILHSAFSIHHRSFPRRRGMTLLEVLISMFVLSVGLLGVAALIPVGRFSILEAGKADRSGACGQAALSEIKVRRMLDPYPWPGWPDVSQWVLADGSDAVARVFTSGSFAIDPLGVARKMPTPGTMGAVIPRISLRQLPTGPPIAMTYDQAERIFMWHDDLQFSLPENMKPAPPGESDRPRVADSSGVAQAAGNYSWLLTVTPAAEEASLPVADKSLFSVSVVVCYSRDYSLTDKGEPNGEHIAVVKFLGQGYGGGSVQLTEPVPADPPLRLRENEWIMLSGREASGHTICHWYRVVSADNSSPTSYVSLVGPDWDVPACPQPTAVAVDHVVGVYTTTVELDRDLLWRR